MDVSGSQSVFGPMQVWPWLCETSLREEMKGIVEGDDSLIDSPRSPLSATGSASPVGAWAFHRPINRIFGRLKKGDLAGPSRRCEQTWLLVCSRVRRC